MFHRKSVGSAWSDGRAWYGGPLTYTCLEEALVDKYVELMVTSHQEDCLWRRRGCDGKKHSNSGDSFDDSTNTHTLDSILRLSLTNAKSSLEGLRLRYDELCSRRSFLPYEFNLRLPEGLDIDTILSQLPSDFFTNPAPTEKSRSDTPNRVALALAILGWQGLTNPRIGAVPNSASCQSCLRRLGLWMFKSKEVSAEGEILVPAAMDHLDPVKEHRFFCPWKNPAAQRLGSARPKPDSDVPAWVVLVQAIRNDASIRDVRDERPRTARQRTKDAPPTPARTAPGTPAAGVDSPIVIIGPDGEEEDESARDAKDKERWARLRKVRSLFDTKGGKKLRRTASRPGTARSTASGNGGAD